MNIKNNWRGFCDNAFNLEPEPWQKASTFTLCRIFSGILPFPPSQHCEVVVSMFCICMSRGSTHYCAIARRVLSHHIVDFWGFRRMKTAPTSIEVLLHPTLVQWEEPSDLCSSLSPTTRHRCTHVLVYTVPVGPRRSPIQSWTGAGVA